MECNYDFRQIVNSLQFLSARPPSSPHEELCRYGYQHYSTMLYWPLQPEKEQWKVALSPVHHLHDERTVDFINSNFLRFFANCHPTPSSSPSSSSSSSSSSSPTVVSPPTIVIHHLSTAKFPLSGGPLTIYGTGLQKVDEVLLEGCEEGPRVLLPTARTEHFLSVHIPSLPYGLYHLQFGLKNGMIAWERDQSPWFGNNAILVMAMK